MKKLLTLCALLPGTALAHGAHPPVSEAAHGGMHGLIAMVVAAVAVGLAALWFLKMRS